MDGIGQVPLSIYGLAYLCTDQTLEIHLIKKVGITHSKIFVRIRTVFTVMKIDFYL